MNKTRAVWRAAVAPHGGGAGFFSTAPFTVPSLPRHADSRMLLLCDIGNTHTHLGLAKGDRVLKQANIPTTDWFKASAKGRVRRFVGSQPLEGGAVCSVVPKVTPLVCHAIRKRWNLECLEL